MSVKLTKHEGITKVADSIVSNDQIRTFNGSNARFFLQDA